MTVRELQSQEAQHVETGAILRTLGRFAMQFELDGRVMTIPTEHGVGDNTLYLDVVPRWDDGEPLDPQTGALLKPVITEIERFWGMEPDFADK
jgi:hypothetical protein